MGRIAQNEPVVGVDIGPDYIRATQVERVGEAYFLRNIGIVETPEGAYEGGLITDPKAMGAALRALFRERRFNTNCVATAIRGRGVVCRIITLPSMPQDRLSRLIENEVSRYVIFSEQDKVVYYYPLEEFDEYERRKVNVLLVVAQKSWCRSYLNAFNEAKLDLVGIDFSTFAMLRELRNTTRNITAGNTMALALDSSGASLNIFHNDVLRFTRQIRLDATESQSLANGFKDRVLAETLLSMQYYQAEFQGGEPIQKLVVSLGATGAEVVNESLSRAVEGVRVITHSPFSNIKVNPGDFPPEVMDKVDTSFLTSVGVALRGQELDLLPFEIDLLPTEVTEGKVFRNHIATFLLMVGLVVLGFVLAGAAVGAKAKKIERTRAGVQDEIQKNSPKIKNYERQQAQRTGSNLLLVETQVTADVLPLLEEVKRIIPKTVQLTGMTVNLPESVMFTGIAEDHYSVSMFRMSLTNSQLFQGVELGPRNSAGVFGKPMVEFSIIARLK